MSDLVQSSLDAVSLGALYALEALAIGLLFGIVRIANFALGTVVTASGYALYMARNLGFLVALATAVGTAIVLSLVMERLVFRPLRTASEATLFIASFVIALTLENLMVLAFGPDQRSFLFNTMPSGVFTFGHYYLTKLSVLTLILAAGLLSGVALMLRFSSIGVRMRAAADDFDVARLVGIRANAVIIAAFAVTGVLSAATALVLTNQGGGVTPALGDNLIVFALLGAVVGGLDRLVGAAAGGFVVGAADSLLTSWLPGALTTFSEAFLVGIVVLLLLVRPGGLVPAGTLKERV